MWPQHLQVARGKSSYILSEVCLGGMGCPCMRQLVQNWSMAERWRVYFASSRETLPQLHLAGVTLRIKSSLFSIEGEMITAWSFCFVTVKIAQASQGPRVQVICKLC